MSMKDIRSFFKPVSSKSSSNNSGKSINSNTHEYLDSKSPKLKKAKPKNTSSSVKKIKKKSPSKNEKLEQKKKLEVLFSDSDLEDTFAIKTSVKEDSILKSKKSKKIKKQMSSDLEDLLAEKKKKKSSYLSSNSIDSSIEKDSSDTDVDRQSNKLPEEKQSSINLKNLLNKKSKKELIEVSSDSDESNVISATPEKNFKPKKRKIQILSSDSEDEKIMSIKSGIIHKDSKKKDKVHGKLKPVSIADIFGKEVKQSKIATASVSDSSVINEKGMNLKVNEKGVKLKKKRKTELGVHEDKDFEQTLIDLDDEIFLQNEDILDKTIESAIQKSPCRDSITKKSSTELNTDKEASKIIIVETRTSQNNQEKLPKKRTLDYQNTDQVDDIPMKSKKAKFEHTDSGIDDQDRYEKKRYCAMQYQQYLNRSGPKHYGEKQYPKGKPDCLSNICFMRTGVLDSLNSEEFEDLIKKHGGRIVHAVSKKVNYVVVGDDPGPAKLQKAKHYGIKTINEDELLDMILQKSGMPKKYTVSNVSSFEDAGINDSFNSSMSEEITKVKDRESNMERDNSHESSLNISNKKKSPIEDNEKKSFKKTGSEIELAEKKPKLEYIKKKKLEFESGSVCLSEKYRPKDLKQIVGQQPDNSNMNKLKNWLELWSQSEKLRKKNKIPRPSPWDKNNDGAYYKCALLSGPPGVGKTTTATLVAETLGFDIVEFNASDTRSKKLLQVEVAAALSIQNIASFNINNIGLDNKRVILMDEVDGMAGNEDRGGMQELILLIKNSKIPIICMCNDRNHQKIRTLANYCFDLRFDKPKPQQILGFVMSICCKEGIGVSPQVVTEIINGTTCDIRQTLNQISMIANVDTQMSVDDAKAASNAAKKDTILGPWQVCKMVFNEIDQKKMSLIDKSRLFFYDYSLGPLFVQENYLKVQPNVNRKMTMNRVAAAAEAISMGATIDKKIRESNNWSLLDMQAIYSSVLPGYYMSGSFNGPIDFPGWLGKNSKKNKLKRLNNELAVHTKIHTSGGSLAMNLDYSKALLTSIVIPLKKKGLNGLTDAVEIMKSYQLLREDLDSLMELCTWPKQKNIMDGIKTTVKSAFTRLYKKEVPLFSYSANTGISKKKAASYDDELNEDENDDQSEHEETIENDNLIKQKAKPRAQKKGSEKPSTSKKGSKSKEKKKK